jgi:hypothetical protein
VPLPPPLAAVVAAASAADDRRRTDIPHTPAGGGRRRVADPTRARSSSIHPPARIWSRQPLGLASRQLKRRNCNRHRQVRWGAFWFIFFFLPPPLDPPTYAGHW